MTRIWTEYGSGICGPTCRACGKAIDFESVMSTVCGLDWRSSIEYAFGDTICYGCDPDLWTGLGRFFSARRKASWNGSDVALLVSSHRHDCYSDSCTVYCVQSLTGFVIWTWTWSRSVYGVGVYEWNRRCHFHLNRLVCVVHGTDVAVSFPSNS